MEPFVRIASAAAPLIRANIDTDIIIPSREITSPGREGYGEKAFAPWRYEAGSRKEIADFVLNQNAYRAAKILVGGANFGCGSSREMAVWALQQFGIRVIIAPSFGAIFRNNCVRNGLLPIALPLEIFEPLAERVRAGVVTLEVDLPTQTIRFAGPDAPIPFDIPANDKDTLIHGLDAIGMTLKHRADIEAFQARDRNIRPWVWEMGRGGGK
ncbi:MAG: 3-isopropylmalate dehydratase small subunit [Betaproteobacteria bacterium]|nr:3-isopropylmalate dehydratase small subunit [Betaproteobacteria bacterium]